MDFKMRFCTVIFFLATSVNSANILSIIIFPSWSHQQPQLAISLELARRGHNITLITTNPPQERWENLKIIDTSSGYKAVMEYGIKTGFDLQGYWSELKFTTEVPSLLKFVSDYTLSVPEVQKFIRTAGDTRFDVVIYEDCLFSAFGGLVHKIGSPPVVGVHTLPNIFPTDWAIGVPVNPSYMPDMYIGYTDRMDFFQRVYNTIFYWNLIYQFEMKGYWMQDEVLRKYFGSSPPSAREFEYNKSLVIMPTDLTVAYPQPLPPNFIQIPAVHIKEPKPLSKDLQEWFDRAEDGVVYFSLGSIMQGKNLEPEKRDVFTQTFAKFPKLHFLWKWESDETTVPGLPDNVVTRKWLPQQDMFAHKNLRLIIMQGGLQSLQEALQYEIPIIGIPLFSDQRHNTWKMAMEGAGISLELDEVNHESLYNAINKIVYTEKKSFKENAIRLSKISKDQIVPPLDTAVWWIEYVIRHNGARHLRPASLDLPWYKLALIDVYSFLIIVLFTLMYLLYFIIKLLTSLFKRKSKNFIKNEKLKNKKTE